MIPPTSIDGTDITGATIDGTDVTEITVDGDTVFSATPDSLISKYELENDLSDSVGSNDLSATGTTSFVPGLAPVGSNALDTSTSSYAEANGITATNNLSSVTVMGFAEWQSVPGGDGNDSIFGLNEGAKQLSLRQLSGTSKLVVRCNFNVSLQIVVTVNFNLNQTYHYAVVVDSDTVKLYEDATLIATDSDASFSLNYSSGSDFYLGAGYFDSSPSDSIVDHWEIHDIALTQPQIQNHKDTGSI